MAVATAVATAVKKSAFGKYFQLFISTNWFARRHVMTYVGLFQAQLVFAFCY